MKKVKVKWAIRLGEEPGTFVLVDDGGTVRQGPIVSRDALAEFAFNSGADELVHDYDLVKYPAGGA